MGCRCSTTNLRFDALLGFISRPYRMNHHIISRWASRLQPQLQFQDRSGWAHCPQTTSHLIPPARKSSMPTANEKATTTKPWYAHSIAPPLRFDFWIKLQKIQKVITRLSLRRIGKLCGIIWNLDPPKTLMATTHTNSHVPVQIVLFRPDLSLRGKLKWFDLRHAISNYIFASFRQGEGFWEVEIQNQKLQAHK